jgi:hypothetical protein
MVHGAAGARCKTCARHRIGIRPAGLLHSAGTALERGAGGLRRPVWYMAIWYMIQELFGFWR